MLGNFNRTYVNSERGFNPTLGSLYRISLRWKHRDFRSNLNEFDSAK